MINFIQPIYEKEVKPRKSAALDYEETVDKVQVYSGLSETTGQHEVSSVLTYQLYSISDLAKFRVLIQANEKTSQKSLLSNST